MTADVNGNVQEGCPDDQQEGQDLRRENNAILRYEEYASTWWKKERFLPKFAYLADDELESLLQLGQEIERYAAASLIP